MHSLGAPNCTTYYKFKMTTIKICTIYIMNVRGFSTKIKLAVAFLSSLAGPVLVFPKFIINVFCFRDSVPLDFLSFTTTSVQ